MFRAERHGLYFKPTAAALTLCIVNLSIAGPIFSVSASRIVRSSAVKASWPARYSASTAVIPDAPSKGTARAERNVLYFLVSFR